MKELKPVFYESYGTISKVIAQMYRNHGPTIVLFTEHQKFNAKFHDAWYKALN